MEYIFYIMIGIGLGLYVANIITFNGKRVEHARDDLEAKKEWIRMISTRTNAGAQK